MGGIGSLYGGSWAGKKLGRWLGQYPLCHLSYLILLMLFVHIFLFLHRLSAVCGFTIEFVYVFMFSLLWFVAYWSILSLFGCFDVVNVCHRSGDDIISLQYSHFSLLLI